MPVLHLWLAIAPAFAGDFESTATRWRESGRMVLVSLERLDSLGTGYDPIALANRRDFAIDIGPHSPPYCPPIGHFAFWSYVGDSGFVPYNGGCAEPSGIEAFEITPEYADLVVRGPALADSSASTDTAWVFRISQNPAGGFDVRWRPREGEQAWSRPIRLVEHTESSLERLRRWQAEQAPALLTAAGMTYAAGQLNRGDHSWQVRECRAIAFGCDATDLAVECNTDHGSILVHGGEVRERDRAGRGGDACADSPIPGDS